MGMGPSSTLHTPSIESPQSLLSSMYAISPPPELRGSIQKLIQTPTRCFVWLRPAVAHLAAAQALHTNVHTSGSWILSELSRWGVIELLRKPVMMRLMVLVSWTSSSWLISWELVCSWCSTVSVTGLSCRLMTRVCGKSGGESPTVRRAPARMPICLCNWCIALLKLRSRQLFPEAARVAVTLRWLTFKAILLKFTGRVSRLLSC